MPTLTNMKMDRAELEEKYSSKPAEMDLPTYPYGLVVRLDEDAIEKLGMSKLPAVGGTMLLVARVNVTSVSDQENTQGGETHRHRNIELQITDMALEKDAKPDAASVLYNGDKAEK
jgi:hypothetical protein